MVGGDDALMRFDVILWTASIVPGRHAAMQEKMDELEISRQ